MSLQALLEKRAAMVREMRALTDTAAGESRDLTDDEATKFDAAKATMRSLDASIERAQTLADAERSMPTAPGTIARRGDGTFEQRAREFSICRAIANAADPGSVDAGLETEISAEIARRDGREARGILVPHEALQARATPRERRALLTTSGGEGLYPERHRDDLFIDRLRESLRVGQLGATVLSGLRGVQEIPRMTQGATAYWVAEHEPVTPSEVAFDTVSMSPKTVGAETEYSRRMMINASPSVEALLRSDLANLLATAIDFQAINGTGLANKPKGIRYVAGTSKVNLAVAAGGDVYAQLLAFETRLATDRALAGSLAWMMSPTAHAHLRGALRDEAQPILMTAGTLLEYPVVTSTHVPDDFGAGNDESPVIFGNWADLMVGYWSAVDILVNPYHVDVYSRGGLKINALQDVDVAVRHPESFVISEGLVAGAVAA